jgi:hypothetical protein
MGRRLFPALLLISVLLVVSVASPALIASANAPEDFAFLDLRMFLIFSACVGFAFFVAACLVFAVSVKWLPSRYRLAPLVLFAAFIVCASLFFPTMVTGAMLDPVGAASDSRNVAVCAVLALSLALLSMTRLVIFAMVFIVFSAVSATISYGSALFRPVATTGGKSDFLTVGKRNVFVVSFDGLSGDLVTGLIRDNPDIAADFSDFVLFTDAFAGAPATEASMRSESFGVRDYHSFGQRTEKELQQYLERNFPAELPSNLISDFMTYGYVYSRRNLKIGDLSEGRREHSVMMHRMWFESVVGRAVTPKIFRTARLRRIAVKVEALTTGLLSDGRNDGVIAAIRDYKGVAPWKAAHLIAFDDFNSMLQGLRVGKSPIAMRKMHFTHSHFPVDFDSSCRMRSTDADWPKTVQNETGLKEEAKCWLGQFRLFKDTLKKLGIYDSSAIIFKSDHGAPASYFATSPGNLKVHAHPLWGYDRYRPLLMIKGFDVRRPRMVFDSSLVGLPDLARTTCLLVSLDGRRCRVFPGVDLLSPIDFSSSREFYIEVVRSRSSSHRFEEHVTVGIRRDSGMSLLQSMSQASLIDRAER